MNADKFQDASRTSYRRDQLFRAALLSFILLAVAHLAVAQRFDLPSLVGDRSGAIFDLWSLQHFSSE